ncbi:MAG: aminotransferase class I/II-fold pyridoxal phosphate-dependent enzyme [candidate division NC10 bacterium]|nr:aminotransferase class I/II-fold pyridoxal phosphate-dependent enzyme [candidate division NC10 bacterium]MBI2163307.1 aminotransferase class I/II-fold pyridoxal phosphate-dependent enzyme [candidate division NC10 bacterium]MBI2458770.1 aminotransferase class I/II-fold pyridoxal phosphate-dependent enzyme [candidate division NC10 bacterium]
MVDLRSDTVTKPTPEMRRAMAEAEVGDDVFGEDPTVIRLEALAAERLGKEAGLFVVSGTMGNQVSLMAQTQRGDEVILDESSHIFNYEVAALVVLSAVQPRTLRGQHGILDPEDIRRAIRPPNIHAPRNTLIAVESSHNRGGGTCYPPETLREIRRIATTNGMAVHLDGARIFNASIATGAPVRELAAQADSVTFCLSKGLGAPVGSVVVGPRAFVDRARRARKMFGGGMRQAGILAAAGVVALETMVDRLREDHENARVLAEGLASLPGIAIDLARVQTNIVIFNVKRKDLDAPGLIVKLAEHGIKAFAITPDSIRMVTHKDVNRAGILKTLEVLRTILG